MNNDAKPTANKTDLDVISSEASANLHLRSDFRSTQIEPLNVSASFRSLRISGSDID